MHTKLYSNVFVLYASGVGWKEIGDGIQTESSGKSK